MLTQIDRITLAFEYVAELLRLRRTECPVRLRGLHQLSLNLVYNSYTGKWRLILTAASITDAHHRTNKHITPPLPCNLVVFFTNKND
jgi:hypothetical protein